LEVFIKGAVVRVRVRLFALNTAAVFKDGAFDPKIFFNNGAKNMRFVTLTLTVIKSVPQNLSVCTYGCVCLYVSFLTMGPNMRSVCMHLAPEYPTMWPKICGL